MALLARELASILMSLQGDAGTAAAKRRAPRVGGRVRAQIAFPSSHKGGLEVAIVWLRDISATGIGLLFTQRLAPDSKFLLLLPTHDQQTAAVPLRVAHARPAGSGAYHIGARFIAEPYLVKSAKPGDKPVSKTSLGELQTLQQAIRGRTPV